MWFETKKRNDGGEDLSLRQSAQIVMRCSGSSYKDKDTYTGVNDLVDGTLL